jgi:hypothetical protein
MAIPSAFVIVLLLGAFLLSAATHYRALSDPAAPAVSLSFALGLVAVLLVFAFLAVGMLYPDWPPRKTIFFGVAFLLCVGALSRFLRSAPPRID